MKHTSTFAILALAMLAAGCQAEIVAPQEEGTYLEATAYAPTDETKTAITNETEVWWQPNDEINVFYGSLCDLGKFTAMCKRPASVTIFRSEATYATGSFPSTESYDYWAIYPYQADQTCSDSYVTLTVPSEQTAVAGSFDPDAFMSIAKSDDLIFGFYNVCGGICFSLTHENVKYVTVSSNNGEALAGKVNVSWDSDNKPAAEVVDGKSAVTLTCAEGFQTGTYYYISLLPGTLSGGFTLTFDTGDSKASKVVSESRTITRSVFGRMTEADSGHEYRKTLVDLGLSVKWATCNAGATSPEDYGDYYAWGETATKSNYDWSTYNWCNGSYDSLTKYNTNSDYGTVDGASTLDAEDDVAHVTWGGKWRMPTDAEWAELRSNCTWTWAKSDEVYGYVVTSNVAGYTDNYIFLPAAGYRNGSDLYSAGSGGYYWTSSLNTDSPDRGLAVYFYSSTVGRNYFYRSYGLSIRPVRE